MPRRTPPVDLTPLPFATPGILEDDGERVRCGVCGRWFRSLGMHARSAHGVAAADYRMLAGLNKGTALVSAASAERYRAAGGARLDAIRPAVNPVMTADADQRRAWGAGPRAAQMRREASARETDRFARAPKPRRRGAARQPTEPRTADHAARISAGHRRRLGAEAIAELVALKGVISQSEATRRFHVGCRLVRKLWGLDPDPFAANPIIKSSSE